MKSDYTSQISDLITQALSENKAVLILTDTVYGLLSLQEGLINQIKKRENNNSKKIVQFIADISQIKGKIPENLKNLSEEHWPGPLTIIYEGIGYRIPDHPPILQTIKKLNKPIYASSANITGQPTVKSMQEAKKIFNDYSQIMEFIEWEPLKESGHLASTVYDYDKKQILREGYVSEKAINLAINKL